MSRIPDTAPVVAALDVALADDDAERARSYPGPPAGRQPVHTVYVPADRVRADVVTSWGQAALAALSEHGPLPGALAEHTASVEAKLRSEPIEDLRIDLEDGYGVRPDGEEDGDVVAAAGVVRDLGASGSCPPFVGLRVKSLEPATRARSVRTLALFLAELGPRPAGFRVTLPKVTSVAQVAAFVLACDALTSSPVPFEIQVETPQAVLGADGRALVAPMLHAARGRCVGLHYGTYDYSASLGVAAPYQSMEHPVADHAKAVLQLAAAGTGVPVSDGSTNIVPVGPREQVHRGVTLHARLVRRSLERGFYQGWDLHPAQLVTRYAATFAFYREGARTVGERLRDHLSGASHGVLDEPATAAAMAGFLARGLDTGALSAEDVMAPSGLSVDEVFARAGRPAHRR